MRSIRKLVLITGILLLVGLYSIAQENQKLNNLKKEEKMNSLGSSEKNKETVRNLYETVLNKRKLELLGEIIDKDYIGVRGEKGASGFSATVSSIITACPDIKWTLEDLIAEGDKVVVRWTWVGTNTSPFAGLPPSNSSVTNRAIAIYQFKNDKIVQAWMESDRLGFLQQIGVVPKDVIPSPATQKVTN